MGFPFSHTSAGVASVVVRTMDETVTVLVPGTPVVVGPGETVPGEPTEGDPFRARVHEMSAAEKAEAGRQVGETAYEITVDRTDAPSVAYTDRLRWLRASGAVDIEVEGVRELPSGRFLVLTGVAR